MLASIIHCADFSLREASTAMAAGSSAAAIARKMTSIPLPVDIPARRKHFEHRAGHRYTDAGQRHQGRQRHSGRLARALGPHDGLSRDRGERVHQAHGETACGERD